MTRAFPTILAALLLSAALPGAASAKDLGVRGATWPVAEPDLLAQIEARLLEMERSGALARLEQEARANARRKLEEPDAVAETPPEREGQRGDEGPGGCGQPRGGDRLDAGFERGREGRAEHREREAAEHGRAFGVCCAGSCGFRVRACHEGLLRLPRLPDRGSLSRPPSREARLPIRGLRGGRRDVQASLSGSDRFVRPRPGSASRR